MPPYLERVVRARAASLLVSASETHPLLLLESDSRRGRTREDVGFGPVVHGKGATEGDVDAESAMEPERETEAFLSTIRNTSQGMRERETGAPTGASSASEALSLSLSLSASREERQPSPSSSDERRRSLRPAHAMQCSEPCRTSPQS